MMRNIVGGRNAATIAASMLATVGSVLPVTAVTAAATVQSAGIGCARSARGDINALQPRDVAGACVSASTSRVPTPPHARQIAEPTCVTEPGVNDRCARWVAPAGYAGNMLFLASPARDGRVYEVGSGDVPQSGGSSIPTLSVRAYGPDGHQLWSRDRPSATYVPQGQTTPVYGVVLPTAAALSPDGNRLYVTVGMHVGATPGLYNCGYQGLLVVYWAPTGQEVWSVTDNSVTGACSEFWTSLAVDSKRVYVTGGSTLPPDANAGETSAYDAISGERVWRITTPQLFGFSGGFPYSSTPEPVIAESRDAATVLVLLYVYDVDANVSQKTYQETIALSSGTGARQWLSRFDLCPQCLPNGALPNYPLIVATTDDTHAYFLNSVTTPVVQEPSLSQGGEATTVLVLVAEDVHTGHTDWTVQLTANNSSAGSGGVTWLAANPTTRMVDVYNGGLTPDNDVYTLRGFNAADGSQAWSVDLLTTMDATPAGMALATDESHLFATAVIVPLAVPQGEVVSIDARTGAVSWKALMGGAIDESGNSEWLSEQPQAIAANGPLVEVYADQTVSGTCSTPNSLSCNNYSIWAYDAS